MSDTKKAKTVPENEKAETSFKSTRKAALVLPSLSIKNMIPGDALFIKVMALIVTKEQTDDDGKPKTENGKPLLLHTVHVTNLQTGELCDMVLPFIVHKALLNAENDSVNSYLGKSFELVKGEKKNRTNEWQVYEIDAE